MCHAEVEEEMHFVMSCSKQESSRMFFCFVFFFDKIISIYPAIGFMNNLDRLNPSLAEHDMPVLANSVDPDQLASEEANWSGSALFVIKYVNLYQNSGSSNLIGWKLEVGVAS